MTDEKPPIIPRRRLLQIGALGAGFAALGSAVWLAGRERAVADDGEVLFDDAAFRRVDPAQVRYREDGRMAIAVRSPRALLAMPDGRVLVGGERAIDVIASDGRLAAHWPMEGEVRALAAAADGRVLATLGGRVAELADGRAVGWWPAPAADAFLTGIALLPDGSAVAADAGSRAVWRGRDGRWCERIDGPAGDGFAIPSPFMQVRVGAEGLFWVANTGRHRLEAWDAANRRIRVWGMAGFAADGFAGCCNPAAFALLPDGGFLTAEKGLPRVKRHTADGRFSCYVAGPDAFPQVQAGLDVAVAADGRVLVLDPRARAVRIFRERA